MALKLEYKEKSGKEYGAAPPSDKEKDKKEKKEKSAKKDTVAPADPVAAKPTAAPVRTVRTYIFMCVRIVLWCPPFYTTSQFISLYQSFIHSNIYSYCLLLLTSFFPCMNKLINLPSLVCSISFILSLT